MIAEMAYSLTVTCNLDCGFLRFSLPADIIDVNLKVRILKGINIYRKYFKTKMSKCSPYRSEVRPYLDFTGE